jgi:outer membrane receptor for ferrienterochelin and colicin
VAGFEYNREQFKNTYVADANGNPFLLPRTSLAYFVEDRWSRSSRLFVMAGLRLDQKYEKVLGYPALPLNFLAGVKFTFPAD